jgi:hypothetical protein
MTEARVQQLAQTTSRALLQVYVRQAEACAARGCAACREEAANYREAFRRVLERDARQST